MFESRRARHFGTEQGTAKTGHFALEPDLTSGGCDVFMKLAPVTAWFVRDRPRLSVVETGITVEHLSFAVLPLSRPCRRDRESR